MYIEKNIYLYYIYLYLHIYEYYSATEKNEILPFAATWMNLENIMLSEISQKARDTYPMISRIGVI